MRDVMRHPRFVRSAAFIAASVGTALALRFIPGAFQTIFPSAGDGGHALIAAEVKYYLISASMGVLAAIGLAMSQGRSQASSPVDIVQNARPSNVVRLLRSVGVALVLLAYAVTWAGGAPAVSNKFVRETLRGREGSPGCQSTNPRIQTVLSLPIVPGVVLAWQEYQLGGQCGWGGWKLYFWCGGEPTELHSVTRWLS
jgi:hypothetical protein